MADLKSQRSRAAAMNGGLVERLVGMACAAPRALKTWYFCRPWSTHHRQQRHNSPPPRAVGRSSEDGEDGNPPRQRALTLKPATGPPRAGPRGRPGHRWGQDPHPGPPDLAAGGRNRPAGGQARPAPMGARRSSPRCQRGQGGFRQGRGAERVARVVGGGGPRPGLTSPPLGDEGAGGGVGGSRWRTFT